MPVETLTYGALAARLKITPAAARSLAKRRRLPRRLLDSGKAVVSVDLTEIRHTPRPRCNHPAENVAPLQEKIAKLQAEIARLEATAAGHRTDFERERDRADRLMTELLQVTAELAVARKATARLEPSLRSDGSFENRGQGASRLGHLVADLVEADRKACR